MEQLTLFDFPDEPTIFKAPIAAIPQDKWDTWWLELLCRPRDKWEAADNDGVELGDRSLSAKQERIPGLS
jgi:hypothetical protein